MHFYRAFTLQYDAHKALSMADARAFRRVFQLCGTEFAISGFGMNSMGARFNPVSISIANSESIEAYEAALMQQ